MIDLSESKINVIDYPNLWIYNDLDDLLGANGACSILYMTSKNYGHWTLLMRKDSDTIEFFDSYGGDIDSELNFSEPKYNQIGPYFVPGLSILFLASKYKQIEYSKTKMQFMNQNVQTCGKWCLFRYFTRHTSLENFLEIMSQIPIRERDQEMCSDLLNILLNNN